MGRMGKMWTIKRHSRANWATMTNPAGWWTKPPNRLRRAWRGCGRSRWSLMICDNRDGRMQPSISRKEIRCKANQNWCIRQSFNRQTDETAAAPAPTPFGELLECHGIVPGILQIPQWTSRPGSSYTGLGLVKLHSNTSIPSLAPPAVPDSSRLMPVKPVEPVNINRCIYPPQRMSI